MSGVTFVVSVLLGFLTPGYVSGSAITFLTSVDFIEYEETPNLTLYCGLHDSVQGQMSGNLGQAIANVHPWSVIISRDGEEVASITQFTPASAQVDLGKIQVKGNLTGQAKQAGYLELTWSSPGQNQSGQYTCEIVGVDRAGQNIHFTRTLTIPFLSLVDLASRVTALEQQKTELQAQVTQLSQDNVRLQAQLVNQSHVTAGLQAHVTRLGGQVEGGQVTCDNAATGGNFSTQEKTVRFSQSYLRSPHVLLSVTELRDSGDATRAYQVQLTGVYTDRFTFTCGQGKGLDRLVISWVSLT